MIHIGQEYKERYEDAERKIVKLQAEIQRLKGSRVGPVAEVVSKYGDPEAFGAREVVMLMDLSKIPYNTKLYAQPAPVSVVLPEREEGEPYWSGELDADFEQRLEWAEAKGFNRAIDKVKELNK